MLSLNKKSKLRPVNIISDCLWESWSVPDFCWETNPAWLCRAVHRFQRVQDSKDLSQHTLHKHMAVVLTLDLLLLPWLQLLCVFLLLACLWLSVVFLHGNSFMIFMIVQQCMKLQTPGKIFHGASISASVARHLELIKRFLVGPSNADWDFSFIRCTSLDADSENWEEGGGGKVSDWQMQLSTTTYSGKEVKYQHVCTLFIFFPPFKIKLHLL